MTPELLTANTTMSAGRAVGQAARGISKGISRGIGMKEEARVVNYTLEIWLNTKLKYQIDSMIYHIYHVYIYIRLNIPYRLLLSLLVRLILHIKQIRLWTFFYWYIDKSQTAWDAVWMFELQCQVLCFFHEITLSHQLSLKKHEKTWGAWVSHQSILCLIWPGMLWLERAVLLGLVVISYSSRQLMRGLYKSIGFWSFILLFCW